MTTTPPRLTAEIVRSYIATLENELAQAREDYRSECSRYDELRTQRAPMVYDIFRPLAEELAAAQNDVAAAIALGPEFKGYLEKYNAAELRKARATIAICELVKP